jgi:molecular chaperone GrpE (heat shock protein)
MKSLLAFGLVFLVGCGVDDASLKDVVIGTEGLENTWDKAVSDVRNEYDRTENRVDDTLVKANEDVLDEEARTTGRVKDTLAKANEDVVTEEHRFNDTVKTTYKDYNMDVVDEEHRFNDRFKTTSKKTNMDAVAEGDKLTDRIVGSDDKTVDNLGEVSRDHEERLKALERLTGLHSDSLKVLFDLLSSETEARKIADEKISTDLLKSIDDLGVFLKTLSESAAGLTTRVESAHNSLSDRIFSLEEAMGEVENVEQAIQDAIDAIPTDTDPVCTLSFTNVTVQFTDYTDRNGHDAYCHKNNQPWHWTNTNSNGTCPNNYPVLVPASYYGDDGITNTITLQKPVLSCPYPTED